MLQVQRALGAARKLCISFYRSELVAPTATLSMHLAYSQMPIDYTFSCHTVVIHLPNHQQRLNMTLSEGKHEVWIDQIEWPWLCRTRVMKSRFDSDRVDRL